MDKLFLTGGHDLEMDTIVDILLKRGIPFHDRQLQWNNANLSIYRDILDTVDTPYIYGIELKEDIIPPSNYIRIDHHNDFSGRPSSLEQVCKIIGVEMDRHLQLIAANDARYIPGMLELGATQEEIQEIRLADRKAQGITEKDELDAEKSISEGLTKEGDLTIVHSLSNHFSPIADRLYPYGKLIIYTEDELVCYGFPSACLQKVFANEIAQGKAYFGGGANGYFGFAAHHFQLNQILQYMETIKHITDGSYSYHVFYFPFRWDIPERENMDFSKQVDLTKINPDSTWWERVQLTEGNEIISDFPVEEDKKKSLFAEQNYFFDFVHPVMYDVKDRHHPLVMHFERKEPLDKGVSYLIGIKGKTYKLEIEAINLNLYSTGVGVLSFQMSNEDKNQLGFQDILNINQFGRRIMPPHYGEVGERYLLANFIQVDGLHGLTEDYCEDFNGYCMSDSWKPARFITSLIRDFSPTLVIHPVIDDRMFVNCTYLNDEMSSSIKLNTITDFMYGAEWYKYIFVDNESESCQNEDMKRKLLCESTYSRWQKYGSLYGITRYSIMLLSNTDVFAKDVLSKHMRTMYSKMVELTLVQQASMLRFSDEVTKVSQLPEIEDGKIADKISSLYKEYIRFVNQIYFKRITAQDQGIEVYDILLHQLDSEAQIKDLDDEISELHEYYSVLTERKRNENSEYLNLIATICLPATIAAGWFGMNKFCDLDIGFLYELLITLAITAIFVAFLRIIRKKK